ncbi:Ig-like domain-containing domain [Adhaeribacter soli]|uniref:SbsA Ig-like domain-containing protein n=1 Tax=Adhaeribacter soli TaxID=2607655 RepID=A0A5N1J4K6_9BACT|nr:Ig-like domain-containing domain [Adhaeribacter soli]KAA9340009.1 hypothetical protein F0P94_06570 [Adhaeribacter soli]
MSVLNRFFAVASILTISGCAAVNAPEGGPRDETKPVLKETSPANGSTNFKGKTISLIFNEDVQPKDLNKELIISPNTGNTYTVRNDRKTINLIFDKDLEENTTYLLDFRQGIGDITEGNTAENVRISFSTGNFIDTAYVAGKVIDYITSAPENNITVGLYPESDTNNIRDHKPFYFTKTGADGSFALRNIKAGNYQIFALGDRNNNEFYDQEKEKIGYLAQSLQVQGRTDSVILKTIVMDFRKPFVVSVENNLDQNTLVYNEGISILKFQTLGAAPREEKLLVKPSEDGKRIVVYPQNGTLPQRLLALSTDSSNNAGVDTVKFALTGKKAIPEVLTFTSTRTDLPTNTRNEIELIFPVPITITGNQPFTIREDTVRSITPAYPKDYTLTENNTNLKLYYTTKAKKTVELIPDTTQFAAINGTHFRSQVLSFGINNKAATGGFSGSIKTNYKSYWLEVLNEKGKVIRRLTNPKTFRMENQHPGNYQLRVKIDENNDGKWQTGDKKLKTMPEKIYLYPKTISVRSNWEISDLMLVF